MPSFDTFALVMALATSRVFCRLPPGSVQPAAAAALGELPALPVPGPLAAVLPADGPDEQAAGELALLPQPQTARPVASTRETAAVGGPPPPPGLGGGGGGGGGWKVSQACR